MYGVSTEFTFEHPCAVMSDFPVQGFAVELLPSDPALRVTVIETVAGQTLPRYTIRVLKPTRTSFGVRQVEELVIEDIAKLTVQLSVVPVSEEAGEV